ncbi:PREDICTED: uncharacterized protein LOC106324163 [Brassica oleracea var. oleracea]|nr:PREDICTED: uncharacterized protein LOC106324163 [Brassica oleracea var. oleracea]
MSEKRKGESLFPNCADPYVCDMSSLVNDVARIHQSEIFRDDGNGQEAKDDRMEEVPTIGSNLESDKKGIRYFEQNKWKKKAKYAKKLKQVHTDPASCNRQTSDTFASHVPLNATPVFCSTVKREKQRLLYEGVSTVPLNALPDFSPVHIGLSPTTRGAGDIKVNSYFKTKRELMLRMKKWALEWKFEYKTVSSNKSRVLLSCVDENCTWRMRAIKLPLSDFFVVKKYVHEHTCDTTHRKANHRQASAKLLGSLICSNYGEKKEGLKPKQIIEQVRMLHGVHINYKQAWRLREEAQILVRGTPEDSYYNLSRWLYKITETNPDSLTYQHVDATGKFKYAFVAFGPSIRGFSLMRRVIAVDGTFLKGKFNGTLLAACAQDGNYHQYPLAFAVVDAENGASWKWFFRGLSQKIPDASDLVFVSDRANSISSALEDVYPLSHHGICRIHLLRNITPTYAKTGLLPLVESAADAYTCHEFWLIFKDIKDKCPELAKYLEDSDFRKWARSYAPANRLTMTTWFFERREAAAKHKHLVTPKVVQKLVSRLGAAMLLNVYQVDRSEFEVKNETMKFVVDLEKRHCTFSMEGSKKMMKRPIKEVYGSDASDGFNKGKAETVERYRALLRLSNEHRLSEIEWHQAASKANSIASQIELSCLIVKLFICLICIGFTLSGSRLMKWSCVSLCKYNKN